MLSPHIEGWEDTILRVRKINCYCQRNGVIDFHKLFLPPGIISQRNHSIGENKTFSFSPVERFFFGINFRSSEITHACTEVTLLIGHMAHSVNVGVTGVIYMREANGNKNKG